MQILKGHNSAKPVRSLAFSPDGTKLASSARDYKTFLWDLATGRYEVIEERQSYTVAFSPDGTTVATGRGTRDVALWHIPSKTRRTLRTDGDWNCYHPRLAFSPDGRHLAGVGRYLRVWEVSAEAPSSNVTGLQTGSYCLAYSGDGATLAIGHQHVVRLWDATTWQVRKSLTGPTATVEPLAYSADGKFVAACAATTLWVWEVASGEAVVKHTISKQHFKDVAFSPDGRLLAFARNDATVCFLDTSDWREVAAYDWEVGPIVSLAYAPDGMRVAAGSGKGKIVVFDVDL